MLLVNTSLKGESSMTLHRYLGVTQETAWFLADRIRDALSQGGTTFYSGPVEADETYVGGKLKNMPRSKREKAAVCGPIGKTAAVGAKDRETNHEAATVVAPTDKKTLQGFLEDHATKDATVYMVDAGACKGVKSDHETVRHSLKVYVWGDAHKATVH